MEIRNRGGIEDIKGKDEGGYNKSKSLEDKRSVGDLIPTVSYHLSQKNEDSNDDIHLNAVL